MVNVEYLSIAEFAERAGVSKQAIYKQIGNENSQIAPYILREGKRTLIKVSALRELYKVDIEETTFTTPTEGIEQPKSTQTEVVEVETPILTTLLTGASARPFVTHHNTQNQAIILHPGNIPN